MEKKEERKQEKSFRKKAYAKPRIVHRQSLEAVAGICDPGKTPQELCSPEYS